MIKKNLMKLVTEKKKVGPVSKILQHFKKLSILLIMHSFNVFNMHVKDMLNQVNQRKHVLTNF